MSAESFSDRVVPFTWTAWTVVGFFYVMILAHEVYATKMNPLLADQEKASTLAFQGSLLFYWFYVYAFQSILATVSLDFATSMGQSATASGFFVSSPTLAMILGVFWGCWLINESSDQRKTRDFIVWLNALSMLLPLAQAILSNEAINLGDSRQWVFWTINLLSLLFGLVSNLPYVAMMLLWSKFTPKREMSFWMILQQCARQGGQLVGPALFALLSLSVRRGQAIAPQSMMAWVMLAGAFLGLTNALFFGLIIPRELPLDEEPSEEILNSEERETLVDHLPLLQRQEVVKVMFFYAFLRQFQASSIEMSTVMELEVSYNWSVERSGIIFTVISLASLTFSSLTTLLMSHVLLQESQIFLGCNIIAVLGTIFLFDFGFGAWGLILAEALVYGCTCVSNGIGKGWATRAAVKGTNFSHEIYWTYNMILGNVATVMASIVGRTLLDFAGNNAFAAQQLVLATLSCGAIYKVVLMVWELESHAKDV